MEKEYNEYYDLIQSYNIVDDLFFHKVMEDAGASEELLQVILEDKNIKVISCTPQYSLRNIGNRSVVLDLFCKDADGQVFHVEMQKEDDTDHQRRMRYCGSNIDTRFTEKGSDFVDLPELFSIMISTFDIFNSDRTVYHIDRVVRENGSVESNGVHEIYVNAKGHDKSEVTELMQYMLDSNGYNPKFPRISSRVQYFKHDNGGSDHMGKSIAELRAEGRTEGILQGRTEGILQGRAEGILQGRAEGVLQGRAEGRAEERIEILNNLGITETEYKKILNQKKTDSTRQPL